MSELARAKSLGVKAIITAAPFVFRWNASNGKWLNEPDAQSIWADFVNQLIQAGYLVPNNPGASTVVAIYLVDEPNTSGLADYKDNPKVNAWLPSEALVNAVYAIRSNPNMGSKFPIATILSTGFNQYFKSGIRKFDWVGFDDYTATPAQWDQEYNQLKNMIGPEAKTILVPQAATGGCGLDSSYDDPNKFNNLLIGDSKIVWLAPFVWFSRTGCPGTRDIPAIRMTYTQIGHSIKSH